MFETLLDILCTCKTDSARMRQRSGGPRAVISERVVCRADGSSHGMIGSMNNEIGGKSAEQHATTYNEKSLMTAIPRRA